MLKEILQIWHETEIVNYPNKRQIFVQIKEQKRVLIDTEQEGKKTQDCYECLFNGFLFQVLNDRSFHLQKIMTK